MIIYLNVKHKTINLLEGNIEENLEYLGDGDDFLDPKVPSMKEIDNLNIKIKNFFSVKDNVKRIRQATDWEKIFARDNMIEAFNQHIQRPLKTQQ